VKQHAGKLTLPKVFSSLQTISLSTFKKLFADAQLTFYTYYRGCGSMLLTLQMSNNPFFYTFFKCAV